MGSCTHAEAAFFLFDFRVFVPSTNVSPLTALTQHVVGQEELKILQCVSARVFSLSKRLHAWAGETKRIAQ